jgi:glycosyltransferase involved in cell wall biosynthesis
MSTLSLAMIVKNEGATIERVLNCAKLFADEMIVVDTGSTDDTVAKARALGAQLRHFAWIDDFAAARNYAFSQCSMDWIIWLDGDDVISQENQYRILDLKKLVLNQELQAVYLRYVYPPFKQWRERIVRRDLFVGKQFSWKCPVHEFIDGIDNQKSAYFDNIEILHDTPQDRHILKKDRNISILRKYIDDESPDDRSLYIYAVECLHSALKEEGEQALKRFFSQVRISEYRYEIYSKMYNFHMHFGETQPAVEALAKAIAEDPSRAEAYYKLGAHLSDKADRPAAAIPLLTLAGAISLPTYGTPEMEAYTYGPWDSLCRTHFRLERWEEAKQFAAKALEHKPPQTQWLADMARWGEADAAPEPLPPQWQEWTEGNLGRQAPRCAVIRILEENGYGPRQIAESLKQYDSKTARGK